MRWGRIGILVGAVAVLAFAVFAYLGQIPNELEEWRPYTTSSSLTLVHMKPDPYNAVRRISVNGVTPAFLLQKLKSSYPESADWKWIEYPAEPHKSDSIYFALKMDRSRYLDVEFPASPDDPIVVYESRSMTWAQVQWQRLIHLGRNPFSTSVP